MARRLNCAALEVFACASAAPGAVEIRKQVIRSVFLLNEFLTSNPAKNEKNSFTTITPAHRQRRQTLHVPLGKTITSPRSSKLQWIDFGVPGAPGTSHQALMLSERVVCFA